jgi:predicted nucleic acid-binding protein
MGNNEYYLVDANVLFDVVRLILTVKPLFETVLRNPGDIGAIRQATMSVINKINKRWIASFAFLSRECRRGNCFITEYTQRIELPRVFTKLLLSGDLSITRVGGSLFNKVERLTEEWFRRAQSLFGIGVLGMDDGDYEVAREIVRVYEACGSRPLKRVLDNAMDILLVATAFNRGYNLVTTDKRLVCGLANQIITGLAQAPMGGVCLANARLGIGGRALSTRVYLIHEQCGSLQCTNREKWC